MWHIGFRNGRDAWMLPKDCEICQQIERDKLMATKRNDDKGYERGARGIDGKHGEQFHTARFPSGGSALAVGKVTGDSGGPSTYSSPSKLLARAKGKGGK